MKPIHLISLSDIESFARAIALALVCSVFPVAESIAAEEVRIGIRANTGLEEGTTKWDPTIQYLNSAIPDYRFVAFYHTDNQSLLDAASAGRYQFVLTNPSAYVELEIMHSASRMLTLKNDRNGQPTTRFGTAIFTRGDRADIHNLADLKGMRFMAVDPKGFGGWRIAWYEFFKLGLDPETHFSELIFGKGSQTDVVHAVRRREVDAGAVRTDMLERMALDKEIKLSEFKILNARTTDGFPFLHSSQLYPEWPFAKMKGSDESLSEKVALALLQLPSTHPAAIAGKYVGWTVPLDYQPVHDMLRDLRIGPYANYGKITLPQAIERAWIWITALLLAYMVAVVASASLYRSKKKLAELSAVQKKVNWELGERMKEMTCLYRISDILTDTNADQETVFNAILGVIPPAWQFPNNTHARITVGDTCATTKSFSASGNFLRADITVCGAVIGNIEVFYPDQTTCPSCVFLAEETTLTNEIAKRIGQFLHRQKIQQDLMESQRDLEFKVELRTKELRVAKSIAENASRAKSEFLSRMSHELRTPLSSVLGYAQIIQAHRDDTPISECKEEVEQIIRAGRHLRELINETLDLARIESGKFSVNIESVNIDDIFDQAIAVIKPLAIEKKLKLIVDRSTAKPLYVNCDPMRTKQVMLNLLSNAVKYNRDQGCITVSIYTIDNKLRFKVEDTGIGIRSTDAKLIFIPFERLSDRQHIEGTGIGLSVSKHIIELMGGTLQFESVLDVGSAFWFDLAISN